MPSEVVGAAEQDHNGWFRFGVVTALPREFAAMRAMLDEAQVHSVPRDPNDYVVGAISAADGSGTHRVVITLLKKPGNNSAAAAASHLVRSFPTVTDVLMVGIAGGIPNPADVDKHVRLGDIVVSNEYGVVQYDNGKLAEGKLEIRDTSQRPSAALVGRARLLESERIAGQRPWERHVARAKELESSARPISSSDRLFAADAPTKRLRHPRDPLRPSGQPKLHYGRIGSANTLLKDPKAREALGRDLSLRAIEMEGSGIADGTWIDGKSYILIRGISDYCDLHKNDVWQGCTDLWQGYAAVVAAAYARALIGSFAAAPDTSAPGSSAGPETAAASDLVLRVCALPIGLRRPRPVNLLMTIGVSRRPSIVLTVGVDGAALLRDLGPVEEMIKACSGERFASRAWALSDDPAWPSQAGARGLIWRVGSATLQRADLARSLAEGFQRPAPDCGDTLVLSLPAGAESRASELVNWIQGCGRQPPDDSAPGAIPIYAWSRDRIGKDASFGEAPDPTVARLLQCLATCSSAEHNVKVRDAYAMRVHAAASPPRQWANADGETLRIHDLSLLTDRQADSPDHLEADRAAAIIPEAAGNPNILYSLAFLPVHAGVLRALAESPRLTRAVAGLITPEEAQAPRPSWSINKVAGYRPTHAGSFTLLTTD